MMMVRPDQADPNWNNSRMNWRACVQLPLYVDGIYSIIDIQMIKTPHDMIVHLADLYNGRNPDIVTLKKDKGDIFS